ncbi:MAG: two-component system response regulator [Thermoplasmata archaeon]|nr:MAG: two-component system response regulator [Thermoplasmata archaeon]
MARIIIADDSQFMRTLLKNIIAKAGHEVVGEASNGQEAVELFKKLNPDLVILDIVMPVMDGMEALKKIMEINPNAKVLMCTGLGQQKLVIQAIELGAKGYIVKPFQSEFVIKEIERILSG